MVVWIRINFHMLSFPHRDINLGCFRWKCRSVTCVLDVIFPDKAKQEFMHLKREFTILCISYVTWTFCLYESILHPWVLLCTKLNYFYTQKCSGPHFENGPSVEEMHTAHVYIRACYDLSIGQDVWPTVTQLCYVCVTNSPVIQLYRAIGSKRAQIFPRSSTYTN